MTQAKYKKPSEAELKKMLSDTQYNVTQKDATERAYSNEYWDNDGVGIYVDIVTGEPLFSSVDKYDSGTGWPSFTKPLSDDCLLTRKDLKIIIPRTEVRSKVGDTHLGHVFDDPTSETGKDYCINSASLNFIPKDEMKEKGYGDLLYLFDTNNKD